MNAKLLINFCRHHHRVTALIARARAIFWKHPLPPGKFLILDSAERADQKFLLKHSARVGPIFKTVFDTKLCICIIGLPLCRRFLQENSADIKLDTIQLGNLFPKGFIRAMQAEEHKRYRKSLIQAIDSDVVHRECSVIEEIITHELHRYTDNQKEGASPTETYIKSLN